MGSAFCSEIATVSEIERGNTGGRSKIVLGVQVCREWG